MKNKNRLKHHSSGSTEVIYAVKVSKEKTAPYVTNRCLVYGAMSTDSCSIPYYCIYPIILHICLFLMKCDIRIPQTPQICSHLSNDSVCWKGLTYGQRPLSFAA